MARRMKRSVDRRKFRRDAGKVSSINFARTMMRGGQRL